MFHFWDYHRGFTVPVFFVEIMEIAAFFVILFFVLWVGFELTAFRITHLPDGRMRGQLPYLDPERYEELTDYEKQFFVPDYDGDQWLQHKAEVHALSRNSELEEQDEESDPYDGIVWGVNYQADEYGYTDYTTIEKNHEFFQQKTRRKGRPSQH